MVKAPGSSVTTDFAHYDYLIRQSIVKVSVMTLARPAEKISLHKALSDRQGSFRIDLWAAGNAAGKDARLRLEAIGLAVLVRYRN
jgi:hypothetical protein